MTRAYFDHRSLTSAIASALLLTISLARAEPVEFEPGFSDYSEAKRLLSKKKWSEAAIVLRSILKSEPNSLNATLSLARALTYSGRREEGLTLLSQAGARFKGKRHDLISKRLRVTSRLFLTNGTFQAYQDGVTLLQDRKYKAAREKLEKVLSEEPDNVEILIRAAQSQVLEDEDMKSAIERLKLARRLDPEDAQIRLWLGRALHKSQATDAGIIELRAAFAAMKDSELATAWLADALTHSGQRAAAIKLLEDDTRVWPMRLQSLVALVKIRLANAATTPGRDTDAAWSARRDLQLVQSRLPKYGELAPSKTDGDLSLDLRRSAEDLKADVQKLLQQVDQRLEAEKSDESA